jgi:hypothetical protein
MNDDLRRLFARLANLRAMADSEPDADRREFMRQDIKQCHSLILKGLNKGYPSEKNEPAG